MKSDFIDDIWPAIAEVVTAVVDGAKSVFGLAKGLLGFMHDRLPYLKHLGTILAIIGIIIALFVFQMLWRFMPSGMIWSMLKKANKAATPSNLPAPPPAVVVIHQESDSDSEGNTDAAPTQL